MTKIKIYNYRYLARIVIEAATPIAVGSGQKNVLTDAMVITDANGLPYIPGTSLTGIIRSMLDEKEAYSFFGSQKDKVREKDEKNKTEEKGSEIVISSAHLIGENGAVDSLQKNENIFNNKFLKHYENDALPIRQHVCIGENGCNKNTGKFDEQIVYKGTRFCFEIELSAISSSSEETEKNSQRFQTVLNAIASKTFRVGSGTRSGLGEMKIIEEESKWAELNLTKEVDRNAFLKKRSSLDDTSFWQNSLIKDFIKTSGTNKGYTKYTLQLEPDDFFLFSSGSGDDDADMTPVKEAFVDWSSGKPLLKENNILIPATSIKGALSHRIAFYYNKRIGNYLQKNVTKQNKEEFVGSKNKAVRTLFGSEDAKDPQRGCILFSDIIEAPKDDQEDKILNHVTIDRFTGGAIAGHLFSEKVTYKGSAKYKFEIFVENKALEDNLIKEALKEALTDITTGMLPLGGGVNRGNGCFQGTLTVESKEN